MFQRARNLSVAVIQIIAMLGVTTVFLIIFSAVSYRSEKTAYLSELRIATRVNADQLASGLALPVWNLDMEQITKVIEGVMSDPVVHSIEVKAAGKTLVYTRGEHGEAIHAHRMGDVAGLMEERRPIVFSNETLGEIRLLSTPKFANTRLKTMMTRFAVMIVFLDAFLVLSLYAIQWRIVLRPLISIERYAGAVSSNLVAHARVRRSPFQGELESLWSSIEKMVRLLEARFAELKRAKEAAEAGDRLKTEFLDIAAHELKTPLTPLTLLVKKAQRDLNRGSTQAFGALLENMERQIIRLTTLVGDLLDVSRLEMGGLVLRPEEVDLNHLVSECLDGFKEQGSTRTLLLEKMSGPSVIEADAGKVHQVVANLIDNAIKYTPEDSSIEVKIQTREDQMIRVSVTDHGVGIPQDKQASLFGRFTRVRSDETIRHSGLGLGLYICRRIVELHGGQIHVQSEEGRGSTFYFDLPGKRKASA